MPSSIEGESDWQARRRLIFQAQHSDELGQHDRAIELLGRALALYPDDAEVLTELARVAVNAERLDDAEWWARSAVAVAPDYAWAFAQLTRALLRQEKLADALAMGLRYRELQPDAAGPYPLLALVYVGSWRIPASSKKLALESVDYALALERSSSTFLTAIHVYHRVNEPTKAARLLETALAEDPNNESLLEWKAMLTPEEKRIGQLNNLLANNPSNSFAATDLERQYFNIRAFEASLPWRVMLAVVVIGSVTDARGFFWLGIAAALLGLGVLVYRNRTLKRALPEAFLRNKERALTEQKLSSTALWWAFPLAVLVPVAAHFHLGVLALVPLAVLGVLWIRLNTALYRVESGEAERADTQERYVKVLQARLGFSLLLALIALLARTQLTPGEGISADFVLVFLAVVLASVLVYGYDLVRWERAQRAHDSAHRATALTLLVGGGGAVAVCLLAWQLTTLALI